MKLIDIRPMLWTRNLDESIEFYEKNLGFVCGEKNYEWGWAALHRDEVEIMFAVPNAHTPFEKPVFSGSLYILVDEVDEFWNAIKDNVKIVYPLENFEYNMREFAIYDNNGYMIQFGKDLAEG